MKSKDNIFSVKRAEDSTGFLLWQVTNLWQREIKKALEQYDLTQSQFVLMASTHWLTIQQQQVTQVVLSNHTKIDAMTTSTVLRTLQKKRFIKRQEHTTDTRAKTVSLTALGKKTIMEAVVTVEKFDFGFFSPLSNKTKEFNRKLSLLLKQSTEK
jgi:DNA-binding MarR family transcriptional regulator